MKRSVRLSLFLRYAEKRGIDRSSLCSEIRFTLQKANPSSFKNGKTLLNDKDRKGTGEQVKKRKKEMTELEAIMFLSYRRSASQLLLVWRSCRGSIWQLVCEAGKGGRELPNSTWLAERLEDVC